MIIELFIAVSKSGVKINTELWMNCNDHELHTHKEQDMKGRKSR